ncbi:MAG: M15 family metallopeptidase [Candidatus Saccharimonadales bacterium]
MSLDTQEKLNKSEQDYDDKFKNIADNYHQTADDSTERKNIDSARQKLSDSEQESGKNDKKSIGDSKTGKAAMAAASASGSPLAANAAKLLARVKVNKTSGGVIGGVVTIGLVWGLLSWIGTSTMLINLAQNLIGTNNGGESALQRRIVKVLGVKLSEPDALCDSKKVKCKMNRITTRGVKSLARKGVIAKDASGNDLSKSTGKYPDSKIAVYEIDGKNITPPNMKGYLANDPKVAARILGRSGAFNLRFEMWRGGVMKKHFFDRFSIKRDGGIADGKNKPGSKLSAITKKVSDRLPAMDGLREKASAKITLKSEKMLARGKKGGVTYLTAVGGCVLTQAPQMITFGVAAVQAARLIPLISDVALGPGVKHQTSYFSNISSSDLDAVGSLLTEKDKNGKSALDSKFLKHEMGVNTNKTGVSTEFAPGYKLLTNPAMGLVGSINENGIKSSTCNTVLSSQAMYAAIATNSAITVAASATVIGGIIKVAAELIIGEVVARIVSATIGFLSDQVIEELAQNDELDKVLAGEPGEKFGDALGVSAMIFKSTGAAARNVPVLRESQITAYNKILAEQEDFQREMDIASLNPFDISSKHTALGSIVNSVNTAIINNGTTGNYTASFMTYVANLPANLLRQTTVSAAEYHNSCTYAENFYMTADEGATPAVNAAGMPCYGYTGNISTERAIAIASGNNSKGENWIKDGDIVEEAPLEDIVREDTHLAAYLDGCGSQSIADGEWNNTAAGCTVDPADLTAESEAVAAFSMDYQISQMIDGYDDEPATSSLSSDESITTPSLNIDNLQKPVACPADPAVKDLGTVQTQYTGSLVPTNKPTIRLCQISTIDGFGQNASGSRIGGGAIINAGAAAQFLNLAKAAKQDGITIRASDSFRLGASGGGNGDGSQYAAPGGSNHQIGVAIDFFLNDRPLGSSGSGSTTSCSQRMSSSDPVWSWLNSKAPTFGIKQYSYESWHWDVDISRQNRCPV